MVLSWPRMSSRLANVPAHMDSRYSHLTRDPLVVVVVVAHTSAISSHRTRTIQHRALALTPFAAKARAHIVN